LLTRYAVPFNEANMVSAVLEARPCKWIASVSASARTKQDRVEMMMMNKKMISTKKSCIVGQGCRERK
jgi:hypothetical protein